MPYSPISAATVLVASVALIAPGAAQAKPKHPAAASPLRAQPAPVRAPSPPRPSRASAAGRRIR